MSRVKVNTGLAGIIAGIIAGINAGILPGAICLPD